MATKLELAKLSVDAYKEPGTRAGYDRFRPLGEGIDDPKTGLRIQAYIDTQKQEIVIAAAGSNDVVDWTQVNKSFVTGKLHEQFKDAINYANDIRTNPEFANYKVSVTGHSLGGGIAQLLAKTFGYEGISTDAPGAQAIADSHEYKAFVKTLGITPVEQVKFSNFTEKGSIVSSFGRHIGQELKFNLIPDTFKNLALVTTLSTRGAFSPVLGKAYYDQHNKENFVKYFENNPDPNRINKYIYKEGKWLEPDTTQPTDENAEEKRIYTEVHSEVAKRLNALRTALVEIRAENSGQANRSNLNSEFNHPPTDSYSPAPANPN